jgi:AcrR family transcriptional regulator
LRDRLSSAHLIRFEIDEQETSLPSPPTLAGGPDPKSGKVQDILAAALAEFYEHGFAAARLDSIAERAGVAKGTIYLYFASKDVLFEEAVRHVILPVIQRIEAASIRPSGSASAMLDIMITTFYREVIATDRRRLLRLLIGEGPRFPSIVAFYHAEIVTRAMAALRNIVRYGIERGEFRASAAIEFPQVIVGPALAGAIWTILFQDIDPIDLDGLCRAHLDIMLKGLLTDERHAE